MLPHLRKVILQDVVGDYGLTNFGIEGVEVRGIADRSNIEEILHYAQVLGPNAPCDNPIIDQVWKKTINDYAGPVNGPSLYCPETFDESAGNLYWVLIPQEKVGRWLTDYQKDIENRLPFVGGDDDFYDYFPSYVDMYRQACELLGYKNEYNQTIDRLGKIREDWVSEALYHKQI